MCGSNSKSTDKLQLLVEAFRRTPPEKIAKVSEFELTWSQVNDVAVPFIRIKFRD